MDQWIRSTVELLGGFGVFLLMLLENVFPPIPSELVLPLAGYHVSQGQLSLAAALIGGILGALAGAWVWYEAGRWLGRERTLGWFDRWGVWVGASREDVEKAFGWFSRHGGMAVFLGRCIPGVRTVISLPAGASEMPRLPFLIWSLAGTAIWSGLLILAGRWLGASFEDVGTYLGPVSWIVVGGLLLVWLYRVISREIRARRRQRRDA